MDSSFALYLGRHTLETALLLAAPVLLTCMVVGVTLSSGFADLHGRRRDSHTAPGGDLHTRYDLNGRPQAPGRGHGPAALWQLDASSRTTICQRNLCSYPEHWAVTVANEVLEKLLGFAMILTRISAFFLLIPVFGWKTIPVRIKVAVTVLMAIFFSTVTPSTISPKPVSPVQAILLIANEATYGLALGLMAALLFSVVKLTGRIIERQMGLVMAEIFDPLTGDRSRPLGSLLEMVFIILFLSANGHHLFLLIIARSYEAFPAGSIPTTTVLASGAIKAGSAMLLASLRLAGPMLAAFLLLLVALAILARIVPEMNILFLSLPLRVGLGLLMAIMFLPFVRGFVAEFADWMGKLLPV